MEQRHWVVLYAVFGVTLTVVAILIPLSRLGGETRLYTGIQLAFLGAACASLLYWPYWHYNNPFPADRYPRITAWVVLGGLLMGSVGTVAVYVGSETVTPTELTQSVLLTAIYGIAAGMLLGTFEAQAMDATEVRTRADALESERDRLLELNDLLRHYILNSASVLLGYTEQLRDDIPEGDQHALDIIEEQGRMMELLASNIRSLRSTVFESKTTTVTDLSTLLESTVSELRPHASKELTVPNEGPAIRAPENAKNGLFLLIDAVYRSTEVGGAVDIECRQSDPDTVTVVITAEPATLPANVEGSLFEPVASDIGLELYLAQNILGDEGSLRCHTTTNETLEFEWLVPKTQA